MKKLIIVFGSLIFLVGCTQSVSDGKPETFDPIEKNKSCNVNEDCVLSLDTYEDNCPSWGCNFISLNKESHDELNRWQSQNYDTCEKRAKEFMRVLSVECLEDAYLVKSVCDNNQCSVKQITSAEECANSDYETTCYDYFKREEN